MNSIQVRFDTYEYPKHDSASEQKDMQMDSDRPELKTHLAGKPPILWPQAVFVDILEYGCSEMEKIYQN